MLFPYTYVSHRMEKMQAYIDFIFYAVWCQAPAKGAYGLGMFKVNPELYDVMTALHYDDSKGAEFFSSHVERIYGLFAALNPCQIERFRLWYRANNDVEKVCLNDPAALLLRYKDLSAVHPVLGKILASFFRGLYDETLLGLAALKSKIGDIRDHSKEFFSKNRVGKCPFCGINDLKGIHHTRREAYDHYLPKYRYPFNSINFRNLAPACHECNSTYKLSKDPAYNSAGRRKAFYPYATGSYVIQVRVALQHKDIANLLPADIALQFGPVTVKEEVDTWKDLYGIEERYKAKLCGENDGKYWLMQVLDECQAYGKQPTDILNMRTQQAQASPYADCNFLRTPFLEACRKIGVL